MTTFAEQGYTNMLGQLKKADAPEDAERMSKDELTARLALQPPVAAAGGLAGFGAGSILGRGIRTAPFKSKAMQSALRGVGGSRALPIAGGALGALYGAGRMGGAIDKATHDVPLQEFLAEQEARMQKESSHTSSFAEQGYRDTLVHLKVAQQPMPQEQQEGPGIPASTGIGALMGGTAGGALAGAGSTLLIPEARATLRDYVGGREMLAPGAAESMRQGGQWVPTPKEKFTLSAKRLKSLGARGALVGGALGAGAIGIPLWLRARHEANAQQQQSQKVAQQPMPQEQQEGPGIGRPIGMGIGGAALGGAAGFGMGMRRLGKSKMFRGLQASGVPTRQALASQPRWAGAANKMLRGKVGRGALIGGGIGAGLGLLGMLRGRGQQEQVQQ